MRIGIDYTSAILQRAGIGRYTRGLVHALSEVDQRNQYVLYSAGKDTSAPSWPDAFSVRELPITDRHMAIIWQRLRIPLPVELITGRIDILHSPDFVLPPVARAATVLTVHDLSFMRYPECSSPDLLRYLMDSVPRSVRRADSVLADSESTRADLIEIMGVPGERIHVLHPAVEPEFTRQGGAEAGEREALKSRYGVSRPYILGLGTLQPRKNFERLIRAYAALRHERRIPHQLVIGGGKGWLYDAIETTIGELALKDDVLLIGFVDEVDLPALYRQADLFAFPSLYEGFGIPILEAMACGTPVVTANVSSMPEVAGGAALLVPPEDVDAIAEALWRGLDDSALRIELVKQGLEQVGQFCWRRSAERLLGIYDIILRNGG